MASIDAMSWDGARYWFHVGYEHYQARGPLAVCPVEFQADKRSGLWTAGKDAARRHIPRAEAWARFRAREEMVT